MPENCITNLGNFSDCAFIFTYINSANNENDFTLELITKYSDSNEKYLAVGFSDDLIMVIFVFVFLLFLVVFFLKKG